MLFISVIVPLYKGKKYIEPLIDNVKKMKNVLMEKLESSSVELIFVNDYPQENINVNFEGDLNVLVVSHDANRGIHQARITGMHHAKGEYLLFLDQDDVLDEDFLFSHINKIYDNDVVVSNGFKDYGDKKIRLYKNRLAEKLVCNYKTYIYGTDMIFSPGQCLVRKSAIPWEWEEKILQKNGCDDFLLWLLMFNKKCKFIANFRTNYYHRETKQNFSGCSIRMNASFEEVINRLEDIPYIKKGDIAVLQKRLCIKKERKSAARLFKILVKSPAICFYTIMYKLSGYH